MERGVQEEFKGSSRGVQEEFLPKWFKWFKGVRRICVLLFIFCVGIIFFRTCRWTGGETETTDEEMVDEYVECHDFRKTLCDVNDVQLAVAQRVGISPVPNRKALETTRRNIIGIGTCDRYKLDELTHSVPYLTPHTKETLCAIADAFQDSLAAGGFRMHRFIITSVLRTSEDVRRLRWVNGNASENSAHQYATTFDITYKRFDCIGDEGLPINTAHLKDILGTVLERLRREGRCYVKYEVKQACFHVTSRL